MCDTSGWGSFKVTYEGCCVINTGSLLRVDQGDGRGRYTSAWWEWDCGVREGKEVIVGITERVNNRDPVKEKKERKRKVVKNGRVDSGPRDSRNLDDVMAETQVDENHIDGEMEDIVFDEEMQMVA